jgi:hypothetical protein
MKNHPKQKISTVMLLIASCTAPLLAQSEATTPVAESVAQAVDPKKAADRLHMANPFYLPSAKDWQITIGFSILNSRVRTDMPAQTFVGIPLAASYSETQASTYAPSLSVKYGIFDRFGIGIAADAYIQGKATTTMGPSTSSSFAKLTEPNGFAGGELSLYGRLAGTRPGQIYLDINAIVRPGLGSSDSTATNVGRPTFTGIIATGINFWWITTGIAGVISYAPSTSVTSVTGSGRTTTTKTIASAPTAVIAGAQFVFQLEWTYMYGRGVVGYSKYVDSLSTDDPINKYPYLTYGAGAGIKFTGSTLLEFNWYYTPEIQGDQYYTGYSSALLQSVTAGPVNRFVFAFSVKL